MSASTHARAAPLTVLALALLVALYMVVPRTAGSGSLLALYLVLVSALTLPHAVIVAFMDSRQGVCRRSLAVSPRHGR